MAFDDDRRIYLAGLTSWSHVENTPTGPSVKPIPPKPAGAADDDEEEEVGADGASAQLNAIRALHKENVTTVLEVYSLLSPLTTPRAHEISKLSKLV
jgi:hypothetical protein